MLNCSKVDKQNTLNFEFDQLHVCLCFIAVLRFQLLSGKNAPGELRQLKLDALLKKKEHAIADHFSAAQRLHCQNVDKAAMNTLEVALQNRHQCCAVDDFILRDSAPVFFDDVGDKFFLPIVVGAARWKQGDNMGFDIVAAV